MRVQQQQHGYVSGHQLLASSTTLDKRDQDLINRLSDISGPLRPGEKFSPYITGYPLPSGRYVVAKTWLDDTARRAGCVLTHSLIIDADVWGSMEQPSAVLELLRRPLRPSATVQLSSLEVPKVYPDLPVVPAIEMGALIDALFFEQPKPMVLFSLKEAEIVIFRLVEALWPAWRRKLSFCSMALQPRSIDGRPFDILVAPKAARSRFSEWDGRRLDFSSKQEQARHPWAAELSRSIFEAPHARLSVADPLGLISDDRAGGPLPLRVTMLWRDLSNRLDEDPLAALGLLDLLASSTLRPELKQVRVEHLLTRALQQARVSLAAADMYHFLRLLVAKAPVKRPTPDTVQLIKDCSSDLAGDNPQAALGAIELASVRSVLANALTAGVALGLARSSSHATVKAAIAKAPDDTIVKMLVHSPEFRVASMQAPADDRQWWERLERLISGVDERTVRWLRRQLLPLVVGEEHAGLLEPLLVGCGDAGMRRAVRTLWQRHRALELPAIRQTLLRIALPQHSAAVRDAAVSLSQEAPALDHLIEGTFKADCETLHWLLSEPMLSMSRRVRLITIFVNTRSDAQLRGLAKDASQECFSCCELLLKNLGGTTVGAVARVITLINLSPDQALWAMDQLVGRVPQAQSSEFLFNMLPRITREHSAQLAHKLYAFLMSEDVRASLGAMSTRRLITALVPIGSEEAAGPMQTVVLRAASEAAPHHPLSRAFVGAIDEASERLARRRGPVSSDLAAAWGDLLQQALSENGPAAARATVITLDYALGRPREPTSRLLVVSYPVVWRMAAQQMSLIEQIAALTPFGFDRAKSLRERLVSQFLRSKWPPGDLVVVAWIADDADKTLRLLVRNREGRRYLSAIRQDLDSRELSKKTRTALKRIIVGLDD